MEEPVLWNRGPLFSSYGMVLGLKCLIDALSEDPEIFEICLQTCVECGHFNFCPKLSFHLIMMGQSFNGLISLGLEATRAPTRGY